MSDDPLIGWSDGSLRFERMLGRGGMGAVYQGIQVRMDRQVAIKVIKPELAGDPIYIERFEREAKTLGKLVHPNVIACHDFGPCQGPGGEKLYVMVLEFVDGWSLGSLQKQKRVTVRSVLKLHAEALEGLAAAHALGIIHRDLKPDNIMVTKLGQAKLADFGLARADDSVQLTQTGAIMGSPAYMAPEACRGEEPTSASDLYSIGCSLFHSLTGDTPFSGTSTLQMIHQHISTKAPLLSSRRPDLPMLDPLIDRCLVKEVAGRTITAGELAKALIAVIPGVPAELIAGAGAVPGTGIGATALSGPGAATPTRATITLPGGKAVPKGPRSDRQRAAPPAARKPAARPAWMLPALAAGLLAVGGAALAMSGGPPPKPPIAPEKPSLVAPLPMATPKPAPPVATTQPAPIQSDPALAKIDEALFAVADGKLDDAATLLAALPASLSPEAAAKRDGVAKRLADARTRTQGENAALAVREQEQTAAIGKLIDDGRLDQADGALATMDEGSPVRARLRDLLQASLDRHEAKASAQLDRAQTLIADGEPEKARQLLEGLAIASRFAALAGRRNELLTQTRTTSQPSPQPPPPAQPDPERKDRGGELPFLPPGFVVVREMTGEPRRGDDPALPFGIPWTDDLRASQAEGDGQGLRIRLRRGRVLPGSSLLLAWTSGTAQRRTIKLTAPGGEKLAELTAERGGWEYTTLQLPEGSQLPDEVMLSAEGREPFLIARAILASGRHPQWGDSLQIVPGTLLPFTERADKARPNNLNLQWAVSRLRTVRPDAPQLDHMVILAPFSFYKANPGTDFFLGKYTRIGLLGQAEGPEHGKPGPGGLLKYASIDDALLAQMRDCEPDLGIIYIDTAESPGARNTAEAWVKFLGSALTDSKRPLIPVVVLTCRAPGDPGYQAWRRLIVDQVGEKMKLLPIIDVGQTFLAAEAWKLGGKPELVRMSESIAAGLSELRMRLLLLAGPPGEERRGPGDERRPPGPPGPPGDRPRPPPRR